LPRIPMNSEEPENSPNGQPGPDGSRMALVRFSGELTLKAPATRRRFVKRLVKNLKDVLKSEHIPGEIIRDHDRLFVRTRGAGDLEKLAHCFGIQSVSLVEPRPWETLEDVVEAGFELYRDAVAGKRFAVRSRRVGARSEIPLGSQEVARALGARLNSVAAGVDLGNPEVSVQVELMPGQAYFFLDSFRGHGGLPLGSEGRAASLISGGFDSAVASWLLLKRGVSLDYVFCNLGGRSHQIEVLQVVKRLADSWSFGGRPHHHSVDVDAVTRDLREHSEQRYWQVVLKRLMLRAAEKIAREREAVVLVTGEAVGQVSSQTLQNLSVISEATPLPILRPLVGFNKEEIISIARKIGTEDLSKGVAEYCAMVPTRPATAAKLDAILRNEQKLDPSLLDRAVAERSVLNLRELDLDAVERPELMTDEIPADATVIDLRSQPAYKGWHYPDALHLDFQNALRAFSHFEKSQRYIVYCEFGLKSAHLAELMREAGFDVRHFGRGFGDLVAFARAKEIPLPDFIV
jgi:thiamine biosynthesis protein ThiI